MTDKEVDNVASQIHKETERLPQFSPSIYGRNWLPLHPQFRLRPSQRKKSKNLMDMLMAVFKWGSN